jgi:ethanolamine transporter EutH
MRFWEEEEEKRRREEREWRREERELQLEMFEITLRHDFVNSFCTVMIAVSISWIVATLTVAYMPDVPVETKVSFITSGLWMLIVWIAITVFFIAFSLWYTQGRRLKKLRERYLPKKD